MLLCSSNTAELGLKLRLPGVGGGFSARKRLERGWGVLKYGFESTHRGVIGKDRLRLIPVTMYYVNAI